MAAFQRNTARRDRLREIEAEMRAEWEANHVFEANVPEENADPSNTFFCTFPYPYMNGRLHLGHAFTVTKADFAAAYQKLKGKNVLFPFAFHCTGMPIQAAANKLKMELEKYGCPPVFDAGPTEEELAAAAVKAEEEAKAKEAAGGGKTKAKKGKLAKKTGKAKTQWDILKMTGIPEEEIPKFTDPTYWLGYFPPLGEEDLRLFGLHCDWRRSFITTSDNAFYDSFIRWQFNTLRARRKIDFGKRPTIYSVLDGQACADHDRSSGEGVGPQEYTLIKLRVTDTGAISLSNYADVFLVAATLRPETMYGQTNCFVLPEGEYGAFEMKSGEIFICSARAAKNMSYQDMTAERGVVKQVASFTGQDLIGLPLKAPRAQYETVYTLPLLTISMGKGTGVVTSVPSDAPDDFAALRDLKDKPKLREKFNVADDMVLPFDVVPIIRIEGYGDCSAVFMCDKLKIKSQNDTAKLKEAKAEVYLKGFYEGVMTVGGSGIEGLKVCDAKPVVKAAMIEAGEACIYYEPEKAVVSRTGDECVVAYLDQWYLKYGEQEWCDSVKAHVNSTFGAYTDLALKQFNDTLDWLREWACSRSFGLGTKLPWDEQFVIESLSDSTIYMAYYTIAHFLQQGCGYNGKEGTGRGPMGIAPDDLNDGVWNYIFLKGEYPAGCAIAQENLDKMRASFEYWYPMNLRVSGKDLIKNHLTMCLYNHAAIWNDRPEMWPTSFWANGHVMVEAQKMAKSLGNFIMLNESCAGDRTITLEVEEKAPVGGKGKKKKKGGAPKKVSKVVHIGWSSDSTRVALADAGDGLDDANFESATADGAILKLTNAETAIKEYVDCIAKGEYRTGELNFHDKVFEARIRRAVALADGAYAAMRYRDVLRFGFYELQSSRDSYRDATVRCGETLHASCIKLYIDTFLVVISPICPHFSDYMWRKVLGNDGHVMHAPWPTFGDFDAAEDDMLLRKADYLGDLIHRVRQQKIKDAKRKKKKAPESTGPASLKIYIGLSYASWKERLLNILGGWFAADGEIDPKTALKRLKGDLVKDEELKTKIKNCMQVASFVIGESKTRGALAFETSSPFDERALIVANEVFVAASTEVSGIELIVVDDALAESNRQASQAAPGNPSFELA